MFKINLYEACTAEAQNLTYERICTELLVHPYGAQQDVSA